MKVDSCAMSVEKARPAPIFKGMMKWEGGRGGGGYVATESWPSPLEGSLEKLGALCSRALRRLFAGAAVHH